LGSGSVESAGHWWSTKHTSRGTGCGFIRQNVISMLVLRNAVCNRQWNQTWTAAQAHRRAVRTNQRQANRKPRLRDAFWVLICWGARVARLSPARKRSGESSWSMVTQPEHLARQG